MAQALIADGTGKGAQAVEAAYGESEPEYPLDLIKEPNSDYEGRKVISH